MKLTGFTSYALRTLQLSALRDPSLVRVDDVVRVHGLARPHIVKIVHLLGKAEFLETVRGRHGGFRLGRPAHEIVVGDVVRVTEGPMDIVECFRPETNTCPLIGICRLSRALREAKQAFMAVLDDLTLEDITGNQHQLLDRIIPLEEGAVATRRSAPA